MHKKATGIRFGDELMRSMLNSASARGAGSNPARVWINKEGKLA